MGLRFQSELQTSTGGFFKVEVHDSETTTYGPELFINGNFNGVDDNTDAVSPLAIGDIYGGGVVFHIDSVNEKIYICANEDRVIYIPSQTHFDWGCEGTTTGASGIAIGTGEANTAAILVGCSETPIAASIASIPSEGYSDWFLPSKDELIAIYTEHASLDAAAGFTPLIGIGTIAADVYWSSSEFDADKAYYVWMYEGDAGYPTKGTSARVRAIRVADYPFGPFKTYGTPTSALIVVQDETSHSKQIQTLNLQTNANGEGVKFQFSATDTKTYQFTVSNSWSPANFEIVGVTSMETYFSGTKASGESVITFTAVDTEIITIFFRCNSNDVSGGNTRFSNIKVREVLIPVTDFTLRGKDGFKLSYTGGDTTYDLIKPSTLSFTMNVDNSTLADFVPDIASSNPERFTVKVYRSDYIQSTYNPVANTAFYELYWFGYINKRVISIKDDTYPFDLNISAVDGILDLKKKDYKTSDGDNFTGKKSILEILSQIVEKLDVQNDLDNIYYQSILTKVNWIEDSMTSNAIDPCVETYLFADPLTTLNDDGNVKFSSYYDLLTRICVLLQCRFLLSNGRFSFQQFHQLEFAANTCFLYSKSGVIAEGSPTTVTISRNDISGELDLTNTGNPLIAKSGFFNRTKVFGKKITNVEIPWIGSTQFGNLLPSQTDLPIWGYINAGQGGYGVLNEGANLLGSWVTGDDITLTFNLSLTVQASIQTYSGGPDTPDPNDDLNAKFILPIWLKAKAASSENDRYWCPQVDGVNTNVSPNNPNMLEGEWVDDQGTLLSRAIVIESSVLFISSTASLGSNVNDNIDVTITTTLANDFDFEGLYLYCQAAGGWYAGGSSGGEDNYFGLEQVSGAGAGDIDSSSVWNGYHIIPTLQNINLQPFQAGEPFIDVVTQSFTEASVDDNQNNPEKLNIKDITYGDGPSALPIQAIHIGTTAFNSTQSDNWQINGVGTGYKIHKLIADEILNYNYLSSEVLKATLIKPTVVRTEAFRIFPEAGFRRAYESMEGAEPEETYCFTNMIYTPNSEEWGFNGKVISLTPPETITSDVIPIVFSNPHTTNAATDKFGNNSEIANNRLTTSTSGVNPSSGSQTSISVGALPDALPENTQLMMRSSGPEKYWETIQLSSSASKGATSISIDAWTPKYPYVSGAEIMMRNSSLMTSAEGSDTQVQFNEGGVFGASANLTFDDSSATGSFKTIGRAEIGDAACDASGGLYAVAVNNTTTASSKDAFACGELTEASGRQAFAGGYDTLASGDASAAFGAATTASGERSFAQGQATTAGPSINAVAINAFTNASGSHSFASGYNSTASGVVAASFGSNTIASGGRSFATGGSTTAEGNDSAAFGSGNTAVPNQSFVAGQSNEILDTHSKGVNAFVSGYDNVCTSDNGFVIGSQNTDNPTTTERNINQFLIGNNLKTPQNYLGIATGEVQLVVGRFNFYNTNTHNLFTIGNGTADGSRSNAFVVNLTGYVGIGITNPTHLLHLNVDDAAKPSTTTWDTTSDERVKTNIEPYTKGLADIIKIEPKTFDYNGKAGFNSSIKGNIGIIAQDIKDVFPETIKTYKAKLNEDDEQETELLSFNPHAITFALINAVKELNQEIKDLKQQIEGFKNK